MRDTKAKRDWFGLFLGVWTLVLFTVGLFTDDTNRLIASVFLLVLYVDRSRDAA